MTESEFLKEITNAEIGYKREQSLRNYSTWRIGGTVQYLLLPRNEDELAHILRLAHKYNIELPIIGQGSNILFSDQGLEAAICLKAMQKVAWQDNQMYAAAGVPLGAVVMEAVERGFADIAYAGGIPGSIGGAVAMNAGCFGHEISENIIEVQAVNARGEKMIFSRDECAFAYRTSRFLTEEIIVSGTSFKFGVRADKESILRALEEFRQRRLNTQPYEYPNCGSVFKNPTHESAGRLIQEAGLKGVRMGDAQISEKHANFIVNLGQAQAEDVLSLIKLVQKTVWEKYQIELKPEVKFLGFSEELFS